MNTEEIKPIDWKSFEAYGHTYLVNAYGGLYVHDPDSRAFNPVPTTTQADGETFWIVQDSGYLTLIPWDEPYQRAFKE